MNTSKLSEKQLMNLYETLVQISRTSQNKEFGREEEESDIKKSFSLCSSSGKQLYKHLTDEQLLFVISDIAEEIGHSPSQKEVFWVWREYVKLRFKKWPYALTAAGLAKNAGKGGKTLAEVQEAKNKHENMINAIREKAKALGRLPHPGDLPEVFLEMTKYKYTWGDVLKEAGLDQDFFVRNSLFKMNDLEEEYQLYLEEILIHTKRLGRVPFSSEIDSKQKEKLVTRCGSWRNALYQIDLEPVTRITPFSATYTDKRQSEQKRSHRNTLYDCYYKVFNLDIQLKQDLIYIKTVSEKLQRNPNKNEVPAVIRQRLQEVCGSWANIIYQLKFLDQDIKQL